MQTSKSEHAEEIVTGSRIFALVAGPLLCFLMLILPPPADLAPEAWRVAAVAVLIAIWWISEAIPIPITSLLPIVLLPLLDVIPVKQAAAPYAHELIFLFMGGFMLALAMERWNLHLRIALKLIGAIGSKSTSIVAGFMLASAFLSMWVSNTATTMMLLPIATSILLLLERTLPGETAGKLGKALMLGIAYSASIGGVGTLIGTPPNVFMAAYLGEQLGMEIGFAEWMFFALPFVIVGLPLAFVVLTRLVIRLPHFEIEGGDDLIRRENRQLGPFSRGELSVAIVFVLTALLWILRRPLLSEWIPGISDAGIALAGGLLLFLIPIDFRKGVFALNWEWAQKLPWGVLLLFGGGLSLAAAIKTSGLADWIGASLAGFQALPMLLILAVLATIVVFLTELTSNTATTNAFVPIVAAVAIGLGQSPLSLVVATALSASCAFMLPVATPPNAIVYGSGRVTIPQMMRAGLVLNLLFIVLITLFVYFLLPLLLPVEASVNGPN